MSPRLFMDDFNSTPATEAAIRAVGVRKNFGSFVALESLDIEVRRGHCVGLLGPNGAGKSTFIGCLYGAIQRSGGALEVMGLDPAFHAQRIKRFLGVVPQENALDDGLTVLENMRIYARFEGVSHTQAAGRIDELLAHMSLEHKRNAEIRSLSGGMKRRLAFVRALLSDPQILVLDEPTTGLDPTVRHLLWEKVLSYRSEGKTILVTTHYMHEAEALCDKILILDHGKVVASGSPRELIESETPGFVGSFEIHAESRLHPHLLSRMQAYHQGHQFCVRAGTLDHLLELQSRSGVPALQMRPSNLEDVYLKLTGQELGDDE